MLTLLWSVMVFSGLLVALGVVLILAERRLVNYGICRVSVNGGTRLLEVSGGQTLLSGLYDCEVYMPSGCGGKGSCGYCKVTVNSGGGRVLMTERAYLSRREIRSNVRLACQVKVRRDMEIRIPEEMLDARLFTSTVSAVRDLTHDIKEIRLRLIDPPEIDHQPGQYVQVRAPSREGDVFRAYSISSGEYETDEVMLNVRLVPGGIGSTHLHRLTTGDTVDFVGPYGEWKMPDHSEGELVCVAGGVGMAPVRNIVHSFLRRWPERRCWLFFGARTKRDIFYLEEFQELSRRHEGFRVICALSDEAGVDEAWDGEKGFIHLSVEKHLTPGVERQAFLCGPSPMIEAVTQVLLDKGVKASDIFWDNFD